jgi:hypothetical protein
MSAVQSAAMTAALLRYTAPGKPTAEIVAGVSRVFFPDAETLLDLTPGRGCFWSERVPIGVSVEASLDDFRRLPHADESYDVVAFDPPQNGDAGARSIMGARYGTYKGRELEKAIRLGSAEAWRVARVGIIVKICEQIRNSKFQPQRDWVCEAVGAPIYDIVHGTRRHAVTDPKWREPQLSARNNGSTYPVFRKDGPLHRRRRS